MEGPSSFVPFLLLLEAISRPCLFFPLIWGVYIAPRKSPIWCLQNTHAPLYHDLTILLLLALGLYQGCNLCQRKGGHGVIISLARWVVGKTSELLRWHIGKPYLQPAGDIPGVDKHALRD